MIKTYGEYIAPTIETQFGKCEKTIADSYDTFQTIKVTNSKRSSKRVAEKIAIASGTKFFQDKEKGV